MRPPQISKPIYWIPRVVGIIIVSFMALMSLDVFGNGLSVGETMLAFFMHNIPAIILMVMLILAWKKEIVGAIAFVLAGLLYIGLIVYSGIRDGFHGYMIAWAIQLGGVAIVTGLLFWLGWKKRKNITKAL